MKNEMVINGQKYVLESSLKEHSEKEIKYKNLYLCLVDDIKSRKDKARELYEDYKFQGLSIGTVEAEGYLRAFIEMEELVKYNEAFSGDL